MLRQLKKSWVLRVRSKQIRMDWRSARKLRSWKLRAGKEKKQSLVSECGRWMLGALSLKRLLGLDGGWNSSCGMDCRSGFKMLAWLNGGLDYPDGWIVGSGFKVLTGDWREYGTLPAGWMVEVAARC